MLQVLSKHLVAVEEGIPSGYQHVVHLGMRLAIFHHLRDAAGNLIAAHPHHTLAEAVPAVHRALVGGEDQDGLLILVLHPLQHGILELPAGILCPAFREFHHVRNAHLADRVVLIRRINQGQVVGCHAHRVPLRNLLKGCLLLRRKRQHLLQLAHAAAALFQRFSPILHPSSPLTIFLSVSFMGWRSLPWQSPASASSAGHIPWRPPPPAGRRTSWPPGRRPPGSPACSASPPA